MRIRSLFLIASFFVASMTQALMPPLWESVAAINGMLKEQALSRLLDGSDSIVKIESVADGYMITTTRVVLHVVVTTQARKSVGPAQYNYQFYRV